MVVPSQDEGEDEGWEWVHAPPGRHHLDLHPVSATVNHDDEDDEFFGREDDRAAGPSAGLLTNTAQLSESLSSTASSPILKHSHAVVVMPKEYVSALDALQHSSTTEWIEPQLVFSKHHGIRFDNIEIYEVVRYLKNLPKAKEALLSLLADPAVFDAVMRNKAFKEFADIDHGSERLDSISASTYSSLYKHGMKAYKLMRHKLRTAVDILLSLLGRDRLESTVMDDLDAIVKSCILVVALLVFLVIGKRSDQTR